MIMYACSTLLLHVSPFLNVFLSGINTCELDPEAGPCEAEIPSYFYNATSQRCEHFVYGGCRGNGNRFSSATDCQRACGEYKLAVL